MTSNITFICTKSHPWFEGGPTPVSHPDAKEGEQEDGWPSGDIVHMSCPNCGHRWKMELPQ